MNGRWRTAVVIGAVAAAFGLAMWLRTMASVPRYAHESDESLGDVAFYPVLLVAALVGGFLAPRYAWIVGLMLGLPALILSPWTAPRGDNDGLWLFIPPLLAVFDVVLIGVAAFAAWLRDRAADALKESRVDRRARL